MLLSRSGLSTPATNAVCAAGLLLASDALKTWSSRCVAKGELLSGAATVVGGILAGGGPERDKFCAMTPVVSASEIAAASVESAGLESMGHLARELEG